MRQGDLEDRLELFVLLKQEKMLQRFWIINRRCVEDIFRTFFVLFDINLWDF